MNMPIEQRVAMESSHFLLPHLKKFAISILCTAGSDDQNEWGLFSGTLVQVGRHILVATASHTLDDPNPDHYRILSDRPSNKEDWLKITRLGRVENERPDIGYLEIDPQTLARLLQKSPCPLSRLSVLKDISRDRLVSVLGNPTVLAKPLNTPQGRVLAAESMCYSTYTVPFAELEIPDADPPLDESIDVFLEYPEAPGETVRLDTRVEYPLPNPKGMSGGGLWDQNFEHGLWSPDSAVLIGIQCGWFESRGYLRAVQVVHWLRLIHEAYEDLRVPLEESAPLGG
jgi:hypothetical protein